MIRPVGALFCWGIIQCELRSADFFDDFLGGLSPDERLGVAVVLFDVAHDSVNQLGERYNRKLWMTG